ncbi:MAG: ABC transporter permease [Marinicella sp.]|nr:ABC transporter permease [Xanthomonadales bacterium]
MLSRAFKVVFFKEVMENLRDKRTVMSSLVMGAVLGPLMMLGLLHMTTKVTKGKAEQQLELPVINIEGAQNLEKHLLSQGVKILKMSDKSPEQAIKDKDYEVILEIDDSYADAFSQGQPARVKLYYDGSAKGSARIPVQKAKGLINAYSSQIGNMRLLLRGISPNITQAVTIESHDQASEQSKGAQMLMFLPYFLILILFSGSMYLAIDTTAGEKERKSLEPLFLNPVSRTDILSGKLAATITFGLITLIVTILMFKLTIPFYPTKKMGVSIDLGLYELFLMFLALFPLAVLASAIQTIIASFSKTFKEAQTYVGLLILIPMIPSLMLMFLSVKEKLWMMAVPILNQNLIINQVMRGEDPGMAAILVTVFSTLLLGLALAWIAVRLYNKESMLFAE